MVVKEAQARFSQLLSWESSGALFAIVISPGRRPASGHTVDEKLRSFDTGSNLWRVGGRYRGDGREGGLEDLREE